VKQGACGAGSSKAWHLDASIKGSGRESGPASLAFVHESSPQGPRHAGRPSAGVALAACGSSEVRQGTATTRPPAARTAPTNLGRHARPRPATSACQAKEVADPQEASSYPAPATVAAASGGDPRQGRRTAHSCGSPFGRRSQERAEGSAGDPAEFQHGPASAPHPGPGGESIGGGRPVPIPASGSGSDPEGDRGRERDRRLPVRVRRGHASFVDNAYDCSGSVSYALGRRPSEPTGDIGRTRELGRRRTRPLHPVYANAGHTYMYVDGVLYDTAGRSGVYASRWQVAGPTLRLRGATTPGSSGQERAMQLLTLLSLPLALDGESVTGTTRRSRSNRPRCRRNPRARRTGRIGIRRHHIGTIFRWP